jgi:hypothetical protein
VTGASGDIIRRLATALAGDGAPGLLPAEEELVLELARAVAHATERRNAPLACYLVGLQVGQAMAAGEQREVALRQALSAARSLLGS